MQSLHEEKGLYRPIGVTSQRRQQRGPRRTKDCKRTRTTRGIKRELKRHFGRGRMKVEVHENIQLLRTTLEAISGVSKCCPVQAALSRVEPGSADRMRPLSLLVVPWIRRNINPAHSTRMKSVEFFKSSPLNIWNLYDVSLKLVRNCVGELKFLIAVRCNSHIFVPCVEIFVFQS